MFNLPNNIQLITNRLLDNTNQVYLVGGCVRNKLLNIPIKDYDIVTNLHPDKIQELFTDQNCDLVGKSFGVVIVNGCEIATFRKDVYNSDIVHTSGADSVEFAKTIIEDLSRRDFTINAIAYNLSDSTFVDPFGGIRDLNEGIFRFVGNADERIKEDPCRILRAFRFYVLLNSTKETEFKMNSFLAIKANVNLVDLIAKERVRLEILKLLSLDISVYKSFELMKEAGVLEKLIKPLNNCYGVDGGQHHNEDIFEHCILACDSVSAKYPLIRLAALLHDIGKPNTITVEGEETHFFGHEDVGSRIAKKWLTDNKFSNDEIEFVTELISNHMFYFLKESKDSAYRRLMSRLTYAKVRDLLRLRMADRAGNKKKIGTPYMFKYTLRKIRQIEKEDQALKLTDLEVNGNDLIELGIKPGPIFKTILYDLLDKVLETPEFNNKDTMICYIKLTYNTLGVITIHKKKLYNI